MEGANTVPASSAISTSAGFVHPKADVVGMCSVKGASAHQSFISQSLKHNQVPMCLLSFPSEQGEHTNPITKKDLISNLPLPIGAGSKSHSVPWATH